jgi:TolB-like protein/Flp pilus assembly protein TadD
MASRLGGSAPRLAGVRETIPDAIVEAVAKALALDPADRHSSMSEFIEAIAGTAGTAVPGSATGVAFGGAASARWGTAAGSRTIDGDGAAADTGRRMLAVLPFENLSPDPEKEFFSDGLTEEMIAELGGIDPRRLGVIARASAMRYKRSAKAVGEIARELGVQFLLSGSVRHAGGRVRITSELVEAADATQIWARSYERPLEDVFAIQSEVAAAIAPALALELFPSSDPARSRTPTTNVQAHELYLRGRFAWNKRTEEDLRRAVAFFQDAIELDPDYAQAYSGLADACVVLGNLGAMAAGEVRSRARVAAERALELDPLLAEAHTSLAYLKVRGDWDWSGAEAEFRRAILLHPGYATARHWYALHLAAQARFDEARAQIRLARELDPLSLIIRCAGAAIELYDRNYDPAIAAFREIVAIDPSFPPAHDYLGRTFLTMGRLDDAAAAFGEAVAHAGPNPGYLAALGHVHAVSGRRAEAGRILADLERMSSERTVAHEDLAFLHAGLGILDRTFELLDRACEERSGWLVDLKVDPSFDALRGDPRFEAILRRIGLSGN